jgi:hypothetical protein
MLALSGWKPYLKLTSVIALRLTDAIAWIRETEILEAIQAVFVLT